MTAKQILMAFVSVLALFSVASAYDVYWIGAGEPENAPPWNYGPGEDVYWSNGDNWVRWPEDAGWIPAYGVPTAGDNVLLNRPGYPTLVDAGTAGVGASMAVGYWDDHWLEVTGGSVAIGGDISVGYGGTGNDGLLTVSGGLISAGGAFAVGSNNEWGNTGATGTLDMSGGAINVTGNLQIGKYALSSGMVDLSGGIINAASIEMTANGLLNITGTGMVVLPGDQTTLVSGYIGSGWIIGACDYDITTPGKTTIYVPEPATLALLSIGLTALLRKRG
jgi:hypothetical protein